MRTLMGFRDFLLYVIPGMTLLASFLITFPKAGWLPQTTIEKVTSNTALATLSTIILAYVVGHMNLTISFRVWLRVLRWRRIFGDPRTFLINEGSQRSSLLSCLIKPKFNSCFKSELVSRMQTAFGNNVVVQDKNTTQLFYLCWRHVELKCQDALLYVYRCLAIFNFSLAMIMPLFLLGLAVSYYLEWKLWPIAAAIVVALIFFFRFAHFFSQFVVNVYRVFYISLGA